MSYSRLQHAGGAVATTLGADITSGATSLNLAASTGWPDGTVGPFYLVVDVGLATEEKILAATRTSLTLNGLTRGVDGTAASAHSSGAYVAHCFTGIEADEANAAANATIGAVTTKGDLLSGTGSQTIAREGVGVDGTVHVADSTTTTGHKWSTIVAANITAGTITTAQIADGTISTVDIADGAITSAKILDGTIATADLADGSVNSAKILNGTIILEDLADGAVDTRAINALAVTQPKLDQALVSSRQFYIANPGGTIQVTNAGTTAADFADFGGGSGVSSSITPPSWATKVDITTTVTGSTQTNASHYHFRTVFGAVNGKDHLIFGDGLQNSDGWVFTERFTLAVVTAQTVKVQAYRSSGTGAYRSDTFDWISFTMTFLP